MSKTGEMSSVYVETLDLCGLDLPLSKERDLADKIAHIKCLHNDIGDQDIPWLQFWSAGAQRHANTQHISTLLLWLGLYSII